MENNKETIDTCNCNVIHEDVVKRVKETIPQEETLYDLADLFKTFGDSTRIEGKVVYYSLDDDHVKGIFDQGLAHLNEK